MINQTLCFMMGPTNVGKSTTLSAIEAAGAGTVGLVEVGNLMRAKYLDPASPFYEPDKFKGKAAPKETAVEAWQMLLDGLAKHEANPKIQFVLIDGQPRDFDQCYDAMKFPNHKVFVNLYADLATREARCEKRDGANPVKLALSKQRMLGDIPVLYELLCILGHRKQEVPTFRTDLNDWSPLTVLSHLIKSRRQHLFDIENFGLGLPSAN